MLIRGGSTPDLGNEPPLDIAGANAEIIDRRDVSLRWLGASILVGITGGLLIGASVYIAFRGLTTLVEQPRKARVAGYSSVSQGDSAKMFVKGDRLLRQLTGPGENRDGLRLPVTIKVGNREIIKVRQFIRVATTLAPTAGLYATNIPPFDPMKLMNQGDEALPTPEPQPEIIDADVSLTKTALSSVVFKESVQILSDSDALAQLEAERAMVQRGQQSGSPISPQFLISRQMPTISDIHNTGQQGLSGDGLFSGIDVRVIPENVTNIVKESTAQPEPDDQEFTLQKGETIQSFLALKGASAAQIKEIVTTLEKSVKISSIGEGHKVRVLMGPGTGFSSATQVLRVSLVNGKTITAIAALSDRGGYVSVLPENTVPTPDTKSSNTMMARAPSKQSDDDEDDDEDDSNEKLGTARIFESLYETAAKNNMPAGIVDEMIRMFGADVDFQRRVTPNDSIEVFYSVGEEGNDKPELLFASITTEGEPRRLYRFQSEDGNVDYLDAQGRSLKRFLLRKPITDAIMRSGFGYRRHPILGYAKLHSGVDWANKIGTPILAAGNGTVIMAGWKSGYGNHTEIQHANGYVTTYSHQSRFATTTTVGARVRQGQIIGYVGTTGLSTGPHLHYEVLVNGHFVDPMKIRLPRDRELDGPTLAEFKRQRIQTDTLLEKAGSPMALARSTGN